MSKTAEAPIQLSALSPQQRKSLLSELAKQQKEDNKKRKAKYDGYKASVSKTVDLLFPSLEKVSDMLRDVKQLVYDKTQALIEKKAELYESSADNQSHTFTNEDGSVSITIGYRVIDGWDDTVNEGIKKVKKYISKIKAGAGDSEQIELLKQIVDKLLSKDAQGNLKASRVLELKKVAENINSKELQEGIAIMESAFKPKRTKNFVSVVYRDQEGKECTLPLNITDADITLKEA